MTQRNKRLSIFQKIAQSHKIIKTSIVVVVAAEVIFLGVSAYFHFRLSRSEDLRRDYYCKHPKILKTYYLMGIGGYKTRIEDAEKWGVPYVDLKKKK